ncbi:PREDICTED: chymotrypsin-1-like [Ceratosolen solmsi marchali]|uniref:Chymotrypsin-1-like n=1 Tax=Ceratosolen solmsi marchali TaxID=326594 RepID=A0AAJ7E1R0_9HYME|nr:PREDICTED: chymotrypsin-1-like [Ceratosolen solmsi marchali]
MKYQIAVLLIALQTLGVFGKNVRIIGGQDADVRAYPFIASFKHVGNPNTFCGGAIISNMHIVTTAQCLYGEPNNYRLVRVYTGISTSDPNAGTSHEIQRVFINRRFINKGNRDEMYLNDIAVVKLKQAIQFNEFQSAIELLDRDVAENESGFVLGWGSTSYPENSYPSQMQKAQMNILPARSYSSFFYFILHDTQFAALDKQGVGPCTGDGGDPFIIDGKLAGLASIIYPCAQGLPDIYTKMYYYIDYINNMMSI